MKLEFESMEELQQLASALQNGAHPMPIVISVEDLMEAANGNCMLPWGSDGYHLPISIKNENKIPEKLGPSRICQKCLPKHKPRLRTYEQVFGLSGTWEEVERGGKKYLRRVLPAEAPFQSEESLLFLAGQLDAYFQLVSDGQRTIGDIARITGQTEPYMWDLCRIWERRKTSEKKGQKYIRYRNGEYVMTDDPTL